MATATTATTKPKRVVALVTHPIQYQAPLFRHLAKDPALELVVVFLTDRGGAHDAGFGRNVTWDVSLTDGYQQRFVSPGPRSRPGDVWRLWALLRRTRADALWIHGWGHPLLVLALVAGRSLAPAVLVRGEARLAPGRLRALWHRWLLRRADAGLAIGRDNRAFLVARGVANERVFDVPYAVDGARFSVDRAMRDPDDGLIVLFVGKLQPHKRPLDLARAVRRLRASGVRIEAWFVGSGPLAMDLADEVCLGFRNQSELPAIYARADVLCLPSEHEPWGLVVNEAAHAGCALVLSDAVGAAADLVVEGETGRTFPAGDVAALTAVLGELARDRAATRRLGERARERVAAYDFESCRLGLQRALDVVLT
ncbi:MAG: glycosyltransferase family 4 protein [Planctomycetota bacterium]